MHKILVIENETSIRKNIFDLLSFENFNVIVAENGLLGVQLAKEELPDLIICDVMMPELDGYGVLETLRQQPITAIIPFIFLTARTEKTDFRLGMELGADDYLTKPFTRAELLAAITSRLKKQVTISQQSQKKLDDLCSSITLALPHEIRTPLNGILGFSEFLIKDIDMLTNDEIREMAEGIHKSGQRLFRLLQNFLLYAELEIIATDSQRIKLLQNHQTIFPTDALTNLIIAKAKKFGRETDLQINLSTPCQLKIGETKLNKILEELIDNALKFSEPKTIVQVKSIITESHIIISFINYGRGITAAQINQLGAYRQFERHIYEQQGLGLGLIIVKHLAELHGGELKIYSQLNEKTLVQVMLPLC